MDDVRERERRPSTQERERGELVVACDRERGEAAIT